MLKSLQFRKMYFMSGLFIIVALFAFIFAADSNSTVPLLPTIAGFPTGTPTPAAVETVPASVSDSANDSVVQPNEPDIAQIFASTNINASTPVPSMPELTAVAAPEQTVIQFVANTSLEEQTAYLESIGAEIVETIPAINTVIVKNVTNAAASPLVVASEPDYYATSLYNFPTSDPHFTNQWNLTAISAPAAWNTLPQNNHQITVAVIDSGICATHPDLVGRILPGYDYVQQDNTPQDEYGHGCAVSGIIAANVDNGIGIAGVAPNAQILPLRVLDAQGIGVYSNVAAAIVYAADNDAKIINLSLGGANRSSVLENAVNYALNKGVIVVAAAGNTGREGVFYPAAYTGVIAVGSSEADGSRSSFSSYGAELDTLAPGSNILSTTLSGDYSTFSGTSMSAPHVSGLYALALANNETPNLAGVANSGKVAVVSTPSVTPSATPTGTLAAESTVAALNISFSVNSTIDAVDATPGDGVCATASNQCTLRAAVMEINALAPQDDGYIYLPDGVYELTLTGSGEFESATGSLDIRTNITITSWGNAVIDGGRHDRVFDVADNSALALRNLIIQNGVTPNSGGGVRVDYGYLFLYRVTFRNNEAALGGAVYIKNGHLALQYAAITDNVAGSSTDDYGSGGGIQASDSVVTIDQSVINNNTAAGTVIRDGGGLSLSGSEVYITNTTISDNNAVNGSAIKLNDSYLWLNHVTIAGNTSFQGSTASVYATSSSYVYSSFSIFADNSNTNCGSAITFLNAPDVPTYNLSDDTSCSFTGIGNIQNVNPLLGTLQDNNGLMWTKALQAGSPAIDAIPTQDCKFYTDARQFVRPVGNGCDIGAYEAGSMNYAPTQLPTATFTPSATSLPTGSPTPSPTFVPTGSWVPPATQTFTPTASATNTATASPTPTSTLDDVPQIGTSFTVNVMTDSADDTCGVAHCSLREAIIAANANADETTIILPAGTYNLSIAGAGEDNAATGDLDITSSIILNGADAATTIVDANQLDRSFHVVDGNGSLTLNNVTIRNGLLTGEGHLADEWGGGALLQAGYLELNQVRIEDNTAAGFGGGIAMLDQATLVVNTSVISNNVVDLTQIGATGGGGLAVIDATITITNSTIANNAATGGAGWGGGLLIALSTMTMTNTTISGNIADTGAAFMTDDESFVTIDSTSIIQNQAVIGDESAAGVYVSMGNPSNPPGTFTIKNTIVALNTPVNCVIDPTATLTSAGYNLSNDDSCQFNLATDKQEVTPFVEALANNGGFVPTHALQPGSPAINAIPTANCTVTEDARGIRRPQGNGCDIGAFEVEVSDTPQTGTTLAVNVTTDSADGVCGVTHCSLREAIIAANANADLTTITLPAGIYKFAINGTAENNAATGDLDINGETI